MNKKRKASTQDVEMEEDVEVPEPEAPTKTKKGDKKGAKKKTGEKSTAESVPLSEKSCRIEVDGAALIGAAMKAKYPKIEKVEMNKFLGHGVVTFKTAAARKEATKDPKIGLEGRHTVWRDANPIKDTEQAATTPEQAQFSLHGMDMLITLLKKGVDGQVACCLNSTKDQMVFRFGFHTKEAMLAACKKRTFNLYGCQILVETWCKKEGDKWGTGERGAGHVAHNPSGPRAPKKRKTN